MTENIHEVSIIFNHLDELLTEEEREHIIHLITSFCLKLSRQEEVENIELSVDEQKNHVGEITVFNFTVKLSMFSGDHYISNVTGRELETLIREALKNLEVQERRRHDRVVEH